MHSHTTVLEYGHAIMLSAVERGILRRTEEKIINLGIDEKSSDTGHTYASILTDIDRSRVLDLVPERNLKRPLACWRRSRRRIGQGSGHGYVPAYMSAARQCVPQADIVHDKFHVSKYLGEAVDALRKQEHRRLSQAGSSPLKAANGHG